MQKLCLAFLGGKMEKKALQTFSWKMVQANIIRLEDAEFPSFAIEFPIDIPVPIEPDSIKGFEYAGKKAEKFMDKDIYAQRADKAKEIFEKFILEGIPVVFDSIRRSLEYFQCPVCGVYTKKKRKNQVACRIHAGSYRVRAHRARRTPEQKEAERKKDALRKKIKREIEKMALIEYEAFTGEEQTVKEAASEIREKCFRINTEAGSPLGEKAIEKVFKNIDEGFFNNL